MTMITNIITIIEGTDVMKGKLAAWALAALILAAQGGAASAHVSAEHLGGLGAGFAHPFTGLDHLAAALMTGLIAARQGRLIWSPILTFLGILAIGMAAGAAFETAGLAEILILLSLPMLATILLLGRRLDAGDILPMLGLFAVAHGYAHGSEIEPSISGLRFAVGAMAANGLLVMVGLHAGRLLRLGGARRTVAR